MRTNIDIDDTLMKQAMKATGTTTKKAAVEASLRQMVQLKKQEKASSGYLAKWSGAVMMTTGLLQTRKFAASAAKRNGQKIEGGSGRLGTKQARQPPGRNSG